MDEQNPLDELSSIHAHVGLLSDLTNPETDLHSVDRNKLAIVLSELDWRLNTVLKRMEKPAA